MRQVLEDIPLLRAAAKGCIAQLKSEWLAAGVDGNKSTQENMAKRDEISRKVLDEWTKKVWPDYTKMQLVYVIGAVKGILRYRE